MQTDLYLIQGNTIAELVQFACKLCEKVFRSGSKVKLVCHNEQEARMLDDSLWSFSATSFVPHKMGHTPNNEFAVVVTHSGNNEDHETMPSGNKGSDVVQLYLSPKLALEDSHSQAIRKLVLVPNREEDTVTARHLYKQFKALEAKIETHNLRQTASR